MIVLCVLITLFALTRAYQEKLTYSGLKLLPKQKGIYHILRLAEVLILLVIACSTDYFGTSVTIYNAVLLLLVYSLAFEWGYNYFAYGTFFIRKSDFIIGQYNIKRYKYDSLIYLGLLVIWLII